MLSYRPAAPPLFKQLLVNPVFLIALTFAVVMSSVVYIRQKQREELASRAQMLRAGPLIVEQSTIAPTGSDSEPTTAAASNDVPPAAPEPAATETPPPVATNLSGAVLASAGMPANNIKTLASAEARAAVPPSPAATTTNNPVINATFYYTEVNRQALDQFAEEAQSSGQFTDFGDFKSGLIPEVGKRMNRQSGVVVLQRVSRTFDSKNLQQQWFVGNKSQDGQDTGITTHISLDTSAPGRLRGEIELLKSFPEAAAGGWSLKKSSSPVMNFDLAAKQGLMVFMALPHDIPQDPNEITGPEGIMHIFNSPAFKNSLSEFTLFIDFDTSVP